jgi:hypothetical protein
MKRILLNTKLNLFILLFFLFSGIESAVALDISTTVTYSAIHAGADIVVKKDGIFIINSDAQINTITVNTGGKLIVNAPYTLTVGIVSNSYITPVVDFQNGSIVTVNSGSTLVVYGLMNNSNNSNGVVFNGTVSVYGNVTGGNGSAITGSGTLDSTGTITTDNSGTIFGSTGDCPTGPCSSPTSCPSFTGSILSSQTICTNTIPTTLTSTTTATSPTPTYQWQSSTTSGIGFADILVNGTNATYVFPSALTQTTYYRLKIKSTCTVVTNQITITVTALPVIPTAVTPNSGISICNGSSTNLNATSAGNTINWYTVASGGTLLGNSGSGANFLVSPSSNTTYYAETRTTGGCLSATRVATSLVTVTALPVGPVIAKNPNVATVCAGTTLTMTLTTAGTGGTGTSQDEYRYDNGSGLTAWGTTVPSFAAVAGTNTIESRRTSTGTGCTTAVGNTLSWAVNPNLAAGVNISALPSGAICPGTSVTFTATPVNGGATPTYKWYNGVTLIIGATLSTYVSAALIDGDAITCEMTSNAITCLTGSPATSNMVTMTVKPGVVTPTVSKVDVSCSVSAGSITVNTPAPSASVSYSIDGIDYSNTTGKFTGLSANTFTVYAKDTSVSNGCDVSPGFTIIISGTDVVNTYKASGWSVGAPDLSQILVFDADYSAGTVNGCSCEVNSGKTVTIASGGIMTITNAINGDGTIVFDNNASLVQTNDAAVNTAIIAYKRISAPMKNFDFTYWSSPVENQIMNVLSPNTLSDKYFSFAGNDWVYEAGGSSMVPARGYIIRVPKPNFWPVPSALTYAQPVEFKGKANNGIQTFAAEAAGSYNLIGNPYPSAVDAKLFLEANSSVLKGTLYYWTHTTAITPSGSFYEYNSNDYATYTLAGGVATKSGNIKPDGTYDDSKKPTDYIPAGKSFFVESLTAGTVNFNNAMRVSGNINQFSRFNTKTGKANSIERHRVWLNLTNTQGLFKQMLVAYLSDATNEFDNSFDGESFDGNTFADFYSVNSSKNLTIQGRALPFDFSDQVPLGYRTTIVGELSIAIDSFEGLFGAADVIIEDKLVNVSHNLKSGPYTFATGEGVFNDRFVLRYTDKVVLGTLNFDQANKSVLVYAKNHGIKVNSLDIRIDKIRIYDLLGRLLYTKANLNSNELSLTNFNSREEFLIVQTVLENGKGVTHKISFK